MYLRVCASCAPGKVDRHEVIRRGFSVKLKETLTVQVAVAKIDSVICTVMSQALVPMYLIV